MSIERTWSVSTYDVFVRPLGPGASGGYSAPRPDVQVTGTTAINGEALAGIDGGVTHRDAESNAPLPVAKGGVRIHEEDRAAHDSKT